MNLSRRFLPFSSTSRILTLLTALWLWGAMAQAQVAGRNRHWRIFPCSAGGHTKHVEGDHQCGG
jgi:hypothetical protein